MDFHDSLLEYTIGQVAFSPVLRMEKYIDEIQDDLRKNGFPKFIQQEIPVVKVEVNNVPRFDKITTWIFQDKDSTLSLSITQEFITLETSHYTTFDSFIKILEYALSVLSKIVGIELVQRVGLRYVDMVRKEGEEAFSQYLEPGILGIPFKKDVSNIDSIESSRHASESTVDTALGQLIVRTLRTNQGIPLPPDLLPNTLSPKCIPHLQEWITFIDFDHFSMQQRDFNTEKLVDTFWDLKEITANAFHTAITDYAISKWGLENVRE